MHISVIGRTRLIESDIVEELVKEEFNVNVINILSNSNG